MVRDHYDAGFGGVLKDFVTSSLTNKVPSVFFYQFNNFFDFQNKLLLFDEADLLDSIHWIDSCFWLVCLVVEQKVFSFA